MSQTYASLYFRPGMNPLNYPRHCKGVEETIPGSYTCYQDTQKIFLDNGIVNPTQTQSQRAATIINYYQGGKVSYGNQNTAYHSPVTFLGKTEGQPGGLNRPIKNKF